MPVGGILHRDAETQSWEDFSLWRPQKGPYGVSPSHGNNEISSEDPVDLIDIFCFRSQMEPYWTLLLLSSSPPSFSQSLHQQLPRSPSLLSEAKLLCPTERYGFNYLCADLDWSTALALNLPPYF